MMWFVALLLPWLVFAHDEVQLDTLHQDDKPVLVEFPFRVDNCDSTITIVDGWTSCACTKLVRYPEGPLVKGDSGVIVARFHPSGQEGDVLREITVLSREYGDAPVATLLITAHVLPPRDPFYAFRFRYGKLRMLQDHVALDADHHSRSVFVANTDSTQALEVRVETGAHSGIAIPAKVVINPGESMPLSIGLLKPEARRTKNRVEWVKLHWDDGNVATIEVLVSP